MSDAPAPEISVIVCHHHGELWRGCFDALSQVPVPPKGPSFELIVVSSNPPAVWQGQWFTWVKHTSGPAEKRNVGAQLARGRYLVFLDDDFEIDPGALAAVPYWFAAQPEAAMLFGQLRNAQREEELDDAGSWLTWTGFLWARAGDRGVSRTDVDGARICLASKSACCAVRRDAFLAVGGFDPAYYILGEETDLAWRLWLVGHTVWYVPTLTGRHWFNTTAKPTVDYYTLRRIHTFGCRNYLRLLTINLGAARLCRTLPLHCLAWLGAALGFGLRGQGRRSWAILMGLGAYLGALPEILQRRAAVQHTRHLSDRALMPLIMHAPGVVYYLRRMVQYWRQGLHG